MNRKPRAVVSWSTGKDSAYALHQVRSAGTFDIVGVLTTLTATYGRVSMHGVREALLDRQIEELGLPSWKVPIPSPCPNEVYEEAMSRVLGEVKDVGVSHVIFGDLFLQDIRDYRESRLHGVGMKGGFPLWMRDTTELAAELVASGVRATLTCVDPKQLDRSFAGRTYDAELLSSLPDSVDPCGENGEFHTVVTAGPMFEHAIETTVGEVIERDGFVFADVLPR